MNIHDPLTQLDDDGIDRRGFLKCMAWAGTGVLWTLKGGVLTGKSLSEFANHPNIARELAKGDFSFVHISDSHIGFNKPANTDVVATMNEAIHRINALPVHPQFLIHTGDLTHLAKPDEFDTVDQVLKTAKSKQSFFVPGEHDVIDQGGKAYLERHGKGTKGAGWYSFDVRGVHFIGLVNVVNLKAGGLGQLGADQLAWLKDDLSGVKSSTPVVVFAHIPLWEVYPKWGWGTDDGAQALAMLKRFGSVTVLNGHIHQTMQKVEGNITFHTARSTAFPQPKPGEAAGPGPMKVDAGVLTSYLGITTVNYKEHHHTLGIIDSTLSGHQPDGSAHESADAKGGSISIDNFTFSPATLTVAAGSQVTWINHDDVPHTIVSANGKFQKSGALDTDQKFSHKFLDPGKYPYYCGMHPQMTGTVLVH